MLQVGPKDLQLERGRITSLCYQGIPPFIFVEYKHLQGTGDGNSGLFRLPRHANVLLDRKVVPPSP